MILIYKQIPAFVLSLFHRFFFFLLSLFVLLAFYSVPFYLLVCLFSHSIRLFFLSSFFDNLKKEMQAKNFNCKIDFTEKSFITQNNSSFSSSSSSFFLSFFFLPFPLLVFTSFFLSFSHFLSFFLSFSILVFTSFFLSLIPHLF